MGPRIAIMGVGALGGYVGAHMAPIDVAFVCVKSYDTAWATMLISQYVSPTGFVVSLQNCMNEETIAGVVGWGSYRVSIRVEERSVAARAPNRATRILEE
jgi:ketopantoate reductase